MPTGAWLPFSLACNSTRTVYFPTRLRSSENAAACVTLVTVKCTWLKSMLRFTVKALTKFVTTAVAGTVSPVTLLASSCPPGKMKLSTTKRPMIVSAITTRALGDRRGRFLSNDCDMLAQYSRFFLTRIYYSKSRLRQEILCTKRPAQHILGGCAHPAVQHRSIDRAEIDRIFQVAVPV